MGSEWERWMRTMNENDEWERWMRTMNENDEWERWMSGSLMARQRFLGAYDACSNQAHSVLFQGFLNFSHWFLFFFLCYFF